MIIDKIILKILNRKESVEELEILETWKSESEKNLLFLNTIRLGKTQGNYRDYEPQKAWQKLESKISPRINLIRISSIAASVLIVLSSLGFYMNSQKSEKLPIYLAENSVQQYILPDDTEVWLNEGAVLEQLASFSESRVLNLDGEAFFDVTHQENSDFVVHLNQDEFVRVVGTSFNLLNTKDDFSLTVFDGKVELHVLDRIIEVERNESIEKMGGAFVKTRLRDVNIISWKTKELVFENTHLQEALNVISKHYGIKINYVDGLDFSNCALRTSYKDLSFEELWSELENIYNFKYARNDNGILLKKVSCE